MCDAAAVAMAAGTAANAYAQYDAGKAEEKLNRQDAEVLRVRAGDALNRGGTAAGRARMEGSAANATAKTQLAKSGVDLSSSMAANIFETTGMISEVNAQTAKANAAREAWGLETAAREAEFQAERARQRGILGAAGASFQGGAQAYGMGKGK